MATGPTVPAVNDWTPVTPAANDWQTIPPAHQEALGYLAALQKSFDNSVAHKPTDSAFTSGVKTMAGDVGGAIAHPLDTAASMGRTLFPLSVAPGGQVGMAPAQGAQQLDATKQDFAQNGTAKGLADLAGHGIAMGAMAGAGGGIDAAVKPVIEPLGTALADRASSAMASAKTGASKLVPALVDGPPESLITRAIKPGKNNVNWTADVQKALPQMKSAEAALGRPVAGIDDALEAANIAKKNIWQQYAVRAGAAGKTGATIDGNQIADAMMSNIDRRTATQNPQLVNRIRSVADTYRHPMTLDDAEDFLQSANKDLNSYYAKNKVSQQVAQNDPEISSTLAEADALRDSLYGKLDDITGPGSAQLKQVYGSLTNVQKELYGRKLVSDRQNPESLSEQLSTVRGAGKIAKGVLTASPGDVIEGAQNIAVSRALKARNSSDAMITRAFQKAQPATPFPPSQAPRFAGLLQRGPIEMQAPAQGSAPVTQPPPFNYSTRAIRQGKLLPAPPGAPIELASPAESSNLPSPAPPFDNSTRAIRQGKLLPAQTGGPIELEYTPEMSGGERVAALMQYLRQHQQLGLPAKASAIPLSGGQQ